MSMIKQLINHFELGIGHTAVIKQSLRIHNTRTQIQRVTLYSKTRFRSLI